MKKYGPVLELEGGLIQPPPLAKDVTKKHGRPRVNPAVASLFYIRRLQVGGKKYPQRISASMPHRNKMSTATPHFRGRGI